jgi:hypothetical protein
MSVCNFREMLEIMGFLKPVHKSLEHCKAGAADASPKERLPIPSCWTGEEGLGRQGTRVMFTND